VFAQQFFIERKDTRIFKIPFSIEPPTDQQQCLNGFLESGLKNVNIAWHDFPPTLPAVVQKLIRILPDPQEINNQPDVLDEIRDFYFREKAFFLINELAHPPKEVPPERFAQFYIDTGKGFTESISQRIFNPERQPSLELDLRQFSDIQGIRFDPLNQAVAISLLSAAFQLKDETWLPAQLRPLNACYLSNETEYFSHDDASYFIPIPFTLKSRLQRLVVRASYHRIGAQTVAPLVCTMLEKRLQKERRAFINSLVKKEHYWKQKYEQKHQQFHTAIGNIQKDLESKQHEIVQEKQSRQKAEQQASSLQQRLEHKQIRNDQLNRKNQNTIQELETIQAEFVSVLLSYSWRSTRLFRKIKNIIVKSFSW